MHFDVQGLELLDVLFPFGFDHSADHADPGGVAAHSYFASVFRLHQFGKALGNRSGPNHICVVSKAHHRLAIRGPIHFGLVSQLFRLIRKGG
jgi:hypothetical protein